MQRTMMLAALLMANASGVCAQDIPLSKILVEKDRWRTVATAPMPVSFLLGEPGGSVKLFAGKIIGILDTNDKLSKVNRAEYGTYLALKARETQVFYQITKTKQIAYPFGGTELRFLQLKGLDDPVCLTLWPDEGHLVIGEADGAYLWAVRIEKDGSFGPGDRYYSLRTKPNEKMHVTAMVMDAGYLLYACTPLGIQVFDPTGRLSGVIAAPSKEPLSAITIGGAKADELFVAAGDKIYARRIQGKASYTLKKK
jgi:hypothetical protein